MCLSHFRVITDGSIQTHNVVAAKGIILLFGKFYDVIGKSKYRYMAAIFIDVLCSDGPICPNLCSNPEIVVDEQFFRNDDGNFIVIFT